MANDSKQSCPMQDEIVVCPECKEWTSYCDPCCTSFEECTCEEDESLESSLLLLVKLAYYGLMTGEGIPGSWLTAAKQTIAKAEKR